MEKTVSDYLFARYDEFFEAEKKIADYIVAHKKQVMEMTVAELAQASGTSDATVSRFCKKCEFKGFHHLKISLAKELSTYEEKPVHFKHLTMAAIGQSLETILANKVEELTQTVRMIDEKQFKQILSLFRRASCIQFAAVGNTLPVALDAAYKFNQLGIKAVALSVWETQLGYALNITEEEIMVIISNSGASKQLVTLAELARERKVPVIGITNSEHSPIAKLSDYHLTTATRERLLREDYCFSRISAMTLIESFYLLLAVGDEKAAASIRKHEELMVDDKL